MAMKLFDMFKKAQKNQSGEVNMSQYEVFAKWIDKHLSKGLPNDVVAINFNLYEGSENTYDVEIVGCDEFDETDEDWASSEVFATRDDLFFIPRTDDIAEWEQGLSFITSLVTEYLDKGKYADKLKKYTAVGIGFVDGDIEILYPRN
jgi:hypothetical protein